MGFFYMKYILFKRVPYDYGAEFQRFTNGVVKRGIGAYDDKDAKILLKLHKDLVEEISEERYEELKKAESSGNEFSSFRDATPRSRAQSGCSVCRQRKQPISIV